MKRFDGLNRAMVEQYAPNPGRRALLPELSLKAQVALMCRVAFREGWNEHLAGHITLRLDDGNLLTNPWELTWDEVCASDIVTVDPGGKVLDSDWNVTPAIGLHLQLHAARPEVHVVMHNHPHYSGIWASAGQVPPVYDQAGAYVPGDLPLFNEYDPEVLNRVRYDDDFAKSAAQQSGGRPTYCDNRYYRAVANGGQGCN